MTIPEGQERHFEFLEYWYRGLTWPEKEFIFALYRYEIKKMSVNSD